MKYRFTSSSKQPSQKETKTRVDKKKQTWFISISNFNFNLYGEASEGDKKSIQYNIIHEVTFMRDTGITFKSQTSMILQK